MVGVSGASAADQTGLGGNELEMSFVAMPAWFADCEFAFLDFGGTNVGLSGRRNLHRIFIDRRL
jgi:hypothetical protein